MTIGAFCRSLWVQRYFVPAAIAGEFKSRVARSKIGTLWFVLHPLAMALVYVLVLSEVLQAKIPGVSEVGSYAVYLLSGMIAWALFVEIVNRSLTVFVEYAAVLKKMNFPKIYLPIVVLGGALVNNLLLAAAIFGIIAFYGFYPNPAWVALLFGTGVVVILGCGIGLTAGILNIFARDVGQVMIVVLNLWFWLTPIVYVRGALNETVDRFLALNPMTNVVEFYQQVILYGQVPDYALLDYPMQFGCIAIAVSVFLLWRASSEMVDVL